MTWWQALILALLVVVWIGGTISVGIEARRREERRRRRSRKKDEQLTVEQQTAIRAYSQAMRRWMYEDGPHPGSIFDWMPWL